MTGFNKNSAFHHDWGLDRGHHESDTEFYARLEALARRRTEDSPSKTSRVKTGMVEVPRKDLEDIVHELRTAGVEFDFEDPFVAEHFETLADRLASYFRG